MASSHRLRLFLSTAGLTLACQTIPGQDVRYEPTPMPVVRAMLRLADVGPRDVVYDLGSGDGRIPITAAAEFGARGVGIEIDPALVARARANAREAGVEDKVEFRVGDMYASDVRDATVVTLFLHPQPNLKLRPKLRSELKPGSRVVSYIWDMGDWTVEEVRSVNRRRIFLWRIPAGAATTLLRGHDSRSRLHDGPSVARVRRAPLNSRRRALRTVPDEPRSPRWEHSSSRSPERWSTSS
jgi:SAM-dependent methyltransferase